jgi:hypothetical protein
VMRGRPRDHIQPISRRLTQRPSPITR